MAWSNSKVFRAFLGDVISNTAEFDLATAGDTFHVALYNNSITPDNDVSAANSAYNAGQWASANEVSEAVEWPAGGVALTSQTVNVGTADTVFWDAADTASGTGADLADVHGCLVYDTTLAAPVADQGVCYNYFGGANSVTNGTFTVVWSASGIFRMTL